VIIAVDGPAAAGKGTVARALARHFGFHFLDTGSLYRMVALAVLQAGKDPSDLAAAVAAATTLEPQRFSDHELRTEEVGAAASVVAVIPEVRAAILGIQRDFAKRKPGSVLDGRDIGTVVCPDADVKLFITATPEVRALRRQKELGAASFEDVLSYIRERDQRDSKRASSPLVAAEDAVIVDTSDMSIEGAVAEAIKAVDARMHASGRTQG
jgi:cytidylate kinase